MTHPEPKPFARTVAALLIATASACSVVAEQARAQSERVLRIGFILSRASQLGAGAEAFANDVAQRTGGRFRIEIYPDAMLGGEVALMRAVQLGALDLAFITGAPLPYLVPAEGIFDIPFLFRDAQQARDVLDGPIGREYLSKLDGSGVVALAWGENGIRELTTSGRKVVTPDDIVGLRLRLPQSAAMTAGFDVLGANVQQIPFNRVYGALQSGRVEAEENPVATILSSRFSNVQTQLFMTNHAYDPAVILMSQDTFGSLSSDDKERFQQAARVGGIASRAYGSRNEHWVIAQLRAQGMNVVDHVDRASFATRAAAAEPQWDALFGSAEIRRLKNYIGDLDRSSPGAERRQ